MNETTNPSEGRPSGQKPEVGAAVEIAIRLAVVFFLAAWCLYIVAPFAGIVLWALVLAVAVDGFYARVCGWMGGRRRLAAICMVLLALLCMIVPAVLLTETLVSGAQHFAAQIESGGIRVPAPPEKVAEWPVVGPALYDGWLQASENFTEALLRLKPQLGAASAWLLSTAGSTGIGLLQLVVSILLAGVFLARSEGRAATIRQLAKRLAGPRGGELTDLAAATVRSVVQGIVGVAIIQAVLAGLGFIVAGVPAAGLWALMVLVAAVVQLPVILVVIPPILVVYSSSSTTVAVVFTVWCVVVASVDNVLKPILFGRGVEVPMVVIFLGAIGGMLTMGILGLFLGAVVLALGYEIFRAWVSESADEDAAS